MFGIRKKKQSSTPRDFAAGRPGDPPSLGIVSEPRVPAYTKQHRLVVWHAKDGWRWRLWAPNGKMTAESGEAYKRRYDCKVAALRLTEVAGKAKLELGE